MLPLQTGGADSFHQILLEEQENDHSRQNGKRCHCEHCSVIRGGSGIAEQLQCQRNRIFCRLVDVQQCGKEIIPSPHEGEDAPCHNCRLHKRSNDQPEDSEIRAAIDLRRFIQLSRNFFNKMSSESPNSSSIELAEWLVQMEHEEDRQGLQEMILQRFSRLAETSRISTKCSPMVHQIQDYVSEHLQDSSLTLKQIAETDLFMNVDYVSKKFYKETGQKFSQYLNGVRIMKARELIAKNPDEPIKNIAEQVGCSNNPQYFSQLFKKQTGMTPTDYVNEIS